MPTVNGTRRSPLHHADIISREEADLLYPMIPWRDLLAGEADNLSLSLAKSEEEFLATPGARSLHISRSWDVDSFLARITSLAAFKGGFRLQYKPPYLAGFRRNANATFAGHSVHRLKNIQFGTSLLAQGFGYECHVVFPHMPLKVEREVRPHHIQDIHRTEVTKDIHLNDEEQRYWIDRIVFPAVRHVLPHTLRQHLPLGFSDVCGKTRVKREAMPLSRGADMNYFDLIPEDYLEAFWNHIVEATSADTGTVARSFQNPILVLAAHDLKAVLAAPTALQARAKFLDHIDQLFNHTAALFPPDDSTLDFGCRDTPDGDTNITLLRKQTCLSHWAEGFSATIDPIAAVKPALYPWMMTRDAGSATAELGAGN